MKKFLAIYIGSLSAREKAEKKTTDEDKLMDQRGMEAWGNWVTANANSIVDHGSPIGKTKRASLEGISDTQNKIVAYTIVQAESHEAAAEMFENHPHFSIFPGDSIEIMECLPMPEPKQ
jgi:hypothetical protein